MHTRILSLLLLLIPLPLAAQLVCSVREIQQTASKAFLMCDDTRSEISLDLYHNHGGDIRTLCPPETQRVQASIDDQWNTGSGYPEVCDVRQNGLDTLSLAVTTDIGDTVINTRESAVSRDELSRLTVTTPPRGVTLVSGVLTVDRAQVRTERWIWPSVQSAYAAVAYQSDTSAAVSTLSSGHTYSHTVSAGTNRLTVIGSHYRCTNGMLCPTGQTVTFNGDSATLHSTNQLDDELGVKMWHLVNPDVVTGDLVIALTGNTTRFVVGAVNFTGADQTTPLGTPVQANQVSSLTVTCATTVPANGMSIGLAGKHDPNQAVTTDAGTEQYNTAGDLTSANMIGLAATRVATGNFTWSHTVTNRVYRCISAPINAAAAAVIGAKPGVHLLPR